jgi:PAS domain S-box-containing protein
MNINSLCWPAAKIAIIYAVVSSIWVLASDPLLAYFLDDAETLSKLQTIADGFYILATAALLFWLIRRQIISAHEKNNFDRTLFQMSPVGLALCQMNGELVDVNKAFAQILGRSVEETLQLSYWDITPKEYAENEQHQLHELKKTGRYGPYEKEYIHKNGRRIPVQLSGTLLERGGERFIWSSVEDITERKEEEKTLKGIVEGISSTIGDKFLQSTVQHLASALNVRYAFIGTVASGAFEKVATQAVWANEKLIGNFEYYLRETPCEQVIGRNACYFENVQKLFPKDQLLIDMGIYSYYGVPLYDPKNNPLGLIVVMDDNPLSDPGKAESILKIFATRTELELERQNAGKVLQEAHDSLEIRVQERTAKLNIYSQKLKQSNRELESFAYLASHDLQEPLRKIITFGDRLIEKSGDLDDTRKSYVQRMQKSAHRMHIFIEDLLEMSKIQSTTRPFELTDLTNLVKEVLEDLEDHINKNQGQVHIGSLPELKVDPLQFSKLFQNLISNSLKYHRDGIPPVIRLSSLFHEEINCWEIKVEDNGIGFDEKYLDRIFRPFERLHGRDAYEGTGIGLAICEKIVHSLGGKISARSKIGEGSIFTITLPKK